jgi:phage shock protein A
MSEHEDRKDHHEKADELERELEGLEREHENLEQRIEEAGDQWERRKADDKVPGAGGEPEQAEEGPEPEAEYPNKRPEGGE